MGAYENPQQIIDTQSGDAWVNAINNISNATLKVSSDVNDYLAEKKQKNEAIEGKIAEDKSKLEDYIYSLQGDKKAGGADYATMYKPALEEFSKLNLGILKKTSTDPAGDREKMSKIKGSIYALKGLIEGTIETNEKIIEASDKQGAGSIDLFTSDPKALAAHNIMSKRLPGKFTPAFIGTGYDNPGYKFDWIDPKTGEPDTVTMTAKEYTDALEKGGGAGVVVRPDISKPWDEIQSSSLGIYKKDKDGKNTSIIEDKYITSKIYETSRKENASGTYVTTEFFVDKQSMYEGDLGTKLKATAAAIFTSTGKDAQSIYNNDMAAAMDNKDIPEYLRLEKLSDDFVKGKKTATQADMDNPDSDYNKFLRNFAKLQIATKVPKSQAIDNPDFVAHARTLPVNKNRNGLTPGQQARKEKDEADKKKLEENIILTMKNGGDLPNASDWSFSTADNLWRYKGVKKGKTPKESLKIFRNTLKS